MFDFIKKLFKSKSQPPEEERIFVYMLTLVDEDTKDEYLYITKYYKSFHFKIPKSLVLTDIFIQNNLVSEVEPILNKLSLIKERDKDSGMLKLKFQPET